MITPYIQKRVIIPLVVLILIDLATLGCEAARGITCPDVRVQKRGSIFDAKSMVLVVTNASAKPLFDVSVSCERWDKRYIISRKLSSGETVEAGWAELPSGFKAGDKISIWAEGYLAPFMAKIE